MNRFVSDHHRRRMPELMGWNGIMRKSGNRAAGALRSQKINAPDRITRIIFSHNQLLGVRVGFGHHAVSARNGKGFTGWLTCSQRRNPR
jgi:hypothetical protein